MVLLFNFALLFPKLAYETNIINYAFRALVLSGQSSAGMSEPQHVTFVTFVLLIDRSLFLR